jgi:hypothetical protein
MVAEPMSDIQDIPAAPVVVEIRTIALVVIDLDPASCIASGIRVAIIACGGTEIQFYQHHKTLETRPMADPVIGREAGIWQSEN